MLNLLVLTPVYGDIGRVQGACTGRGGGSTLQQRGWPSPPSHTQPCFYLPLVAHLNGGHCWGVLCPFDGTLLLLMGSLGLFRATQATLCIHPRGMPVSITPAAPAPTFPGLLLQSLKKESRL